ncbi:hypothetical protein J2Y45_003116 [Dyadobacter sp. BE34]|uniref:Uncharacterized protein n=1 Tax=Dyadobacter fermentans TaxID=94254 RepID=A0ABU1QUZ3_9BACT|nr:hypothetical protein [Dyadobacter fermentans]MDR7043665.1 hypothetical protein [Dyadobacter sp. BE242]MDR7197977.1 hypothetical protein [Dyadobacter sp. BE34]MDR7214589.1 hypothetical protein [Dyadobacter sp. BE31]MDR7262124.1 hypothetical protein [Dyadobacter sp. BE32]
MINQEPIPNAAVPYRITGVLVAQVLHQLTSMYSASSFIQSWEEASKHGLFKSKSNVASAAVAVEATDILMFRYFHPVSMSSCCQRYLCGSTVPEAGAE